MKAAALALALATSLAFPAQSTLLNLNIKLYGSDFRSEIGTFAPIDGELVDFDILFDDAKDIPKTRSGLRIKSANFRWKEPLYYAYLAVLDGGVLTFGTDPFVSGFGISPSTNTFGTSIRRPGGSVWVQSGLYTMSDDLTYEQSLQIVATSLGAPAVPEPATWLLLSVGFGAIGLAVRRRRARVNVAH